MEKIYDLKEKLCKELEDYARKLDTGAGAGVLEVIHMLTDTIKNIDKICMLEEDGGYSRDGEYEDGGYGRGSSYANRGQHWVRGHYSRENGNMGGGNYSGRRDNRGRYSRGDGRSEMMEHLEMAMDAANEQDRENIKRWMRQLENA